MRRIIKIFQKIAAEDGSVIHEIRDVASRDQNGNVFRGRQQVMYRCPSCGQPLEERKFRVACPLCCSELFGEPGCCDFCHTEREKLMIFTFEKIIALEKERRSLLESRVFDSVPFVRFIRQYQAFNSVKRLEDARKKLLGED